MSRLVSVKILESDVKRIEGARIHKTEPRWSVIERAMDALVKIHKR